MDKNKCLEMIQNILNSVFNGYYETRILRQDIGKEEWAHAIRIAKRMPFTTLFEKQKLDELVKCFEYMKSDAVPAEPGLQSGFVQPAEGVEVPKGKTTVASTEKLVEEPVTEPAIEEVATEMAEESVETTKIAEEPVEEAPVSEATAEPDPVETIVEASEPTTGEEAPAEDTKSRRRKK